MSNLLFRHILLLVSSLLLLTMLSFSMTLFFPADIYWVSEQADSHLFTQYIQYLSSIMSGDWGVSASRGTSVLDEFITHFPATLELTMTALLFALVFGLPLGVISARAKNKWPDKLIASTTLVSYSMPIFWWGMLLVLLFSISLGITPVASRIGFEYDIMPKTGFMLIDTLLSEQPYSLEAFYNALHHLVLPAIVLGTVPLATLTRVTRSAMIKALASDYIKSARAKGLSLGRILWVHAFRNALIPIITAVGLQISVLITGTIITEIIFSWPGVGKWLLEAVYRRDLVTLHAGLLAIASMVIITNALIDIASHYINPRLRQQR